MLSLGFVHQHRRAAERAYTMREPDMIGMHVGQHYGANVAPSDADLVNGAFECSETLGRVHAAVDEQVAVVDAHQVETDGLQLERQRQLNAVNAWNEFLVMCQIASLAWYELRTNGPDSACVNPIS